MIPLALLGCAVSATPTVDAPRPSGWEPPAGFWEHWGDGRAELDGYRLVTPRYGELRQGYAVHVWVTETFTRAARVKSDGGHPDEFPVLKLNELRHFQTGIYAYDVLTSVFVPLDGSAPDGVPTKVSFSAHEWCGAVYDQLVVDGGAFRRDRHSYFDGEADLEATLPLRDARFADALPFVVRGLGSVRSQGEVPLALLPTLADTRLGHRAFEAGPAVLSWSAGPRDLSVPAGSFRVRSATLARPDGTSTTWEVEEAPPHRIVAWARSDGESAVLTGSVRLAYWEAHDPGDEALLADLGLAGAATP